MAISPELQTIKSCSSHLETLFKTPERSLVHYLNGEGFIGEDLCEDLLNPRSMLSERQKAGMLTAAIEKAVSLDNHKYHMLISYFSGNGSLYIGTLRLLTEEYSKIGKSVIEQELKPRPQECSTNVDLPGLETVKKTDTEFHGGTGLSFNRRIFLNTWMTFIIKETLPVFSILQVFGLCLSGLYESSSDNFEKEKFIWAFIGELILLLTIRAMTANADIDNNIWEGLSLLEAQKRIDMVDKAFRLTLIFALVYSFAVWCRFSGEVAWLFGVQIAITFLMYFIHRKCFSVPLVLLETLFQFFGGLYVSILGGRSIQNHLAYLAILLILYLSGFFTHNVCRSLDPTEDSLLELFGKWATAVLFITLIMMGWGSSYLIGLNQIFWPIEGVLLVGVVVWVMFAKDKNKLLRAITLLISKMMHFVSAAHLLMIAWSDFLSKYFELV